MAFKRINLDKDIIRKNKIPLLIEDSNWIKLFGQVKDKNIQYLKDEVTHLVEKKRELEKREKELQKEKLYSMKMILGISDAVNNENRIEALGLLDEHKGKIEKINEELEDISYQLENLPQEIRDLNFDLLEATVEYGYRELKKKEKRLKDVNDELDAIRERIRALINEKYDCEEWIESAYSFLHGMLGSEEIEKLDKIIYEKGESL
ncbi:MAG: hypothetical protein GXY88_00475 [Tissierellia bacterium]|nr:hypothetical protein [Tissierellia bacterium]